MIGAKRKLSMATSKATRFANTSKAKSMLVDMEVRESLDISDEEMKESETDEKSGKTAVDSKAATMPRAMTVKIEDK